MKESAGFFYTCIDTRKKKQKKVKFLLGCARVNFCNKHGNPFKWHKE